MITTEQAKAELDNYLRTHFSIGIEDVEITETKGYWRTKKECDKTCQHPLHGCIGNEGRMKHTISYIRYRRENGRFVSPYEVWTVLNAGELK